MYFEVVRQLESPTTSLEDVGQNIARDPAMTAKLLQLVNSAVFGLQLTISQPNEAVAYLGIETTKSLILLAHTFSYFDHLATSGFSIDSLWTHSYSTARCAQRIAEHEWTSQELIAQAFAAGLLHDIGKLMLAANLPAEFQEALWRASHEGMELWQAELQILGAHHAEVGACMLATWGLPTAIVEAVALHHHPARVSAGGFTPLVAVHVANVLSQLSPLNATQPIRPQLDTEYLRVTGFTERVVEWTLVLAANPAPVALAG
jgi:putative nucleotidyltransferase with HDIG domain